MTRRMTVALLVAVLAGVPLFAADFTGWITDEHCGAKGTSPGHKSCALKCAEGGAALVLYDPAGEKLYKLSDQDAAKKNVGHKVKVTGTLDGDTITVESIAEAAEKSE